MDFTQYLGSIFVMILLIHYYVILDFVYLVKLHFFYSRKGKVDYWGCRKDTPTAANNANCTYSTKFY